MGLLNDFISLFSPPPKQYNCLRVTYVNRLRRAGVPREAAMRLVNHASELIHRIYQREKIVSVLATPSGRRGRRAGKLTGCQADFG